MAALRIVDAKEHGVRLMHLIRNSGLTYQDVSKAVTPEIKGSTDEGFISWYVTQNPKKGPKTVDAKRAWILAHFLAGKGQLHEDEQVLWEWLMGVKNNPSEVLVPHLRVVDGADGSSAGDVTTTLWYQQSLAHQDFSVPQDEEQEQVARAISPAA